MKTSKSVKTSIVNAINAEQSNILSLIALSEDNAQTIEVTTPILVAATAIDGAKASAKIIIMRSLANDCQILINLLNAADEGTPELEALERIVNRYVSNLASKYASQTHTIILTEAGYTYEKRDPAVLARLELEREIAVLQPSIDTLKDHSLKLFDAVNALTTASEADAKRKLSCYIVANDIAKALSANNAILHATDSYAALITDIDSSESYSLNALEALKTLALAYVTQAKDKSTQLKTVRENYSQALKNAKQCVLVKNKPVSKALDALPSKTLSELEAATTILCAIASQNERMPENITLPAYTETDTVQSWLTAITQIIDAELIAREHEAEKTAIVDSHEAEKLELVDKHQQDLLDVQQASRAGALIDKELEEFLDLSQNCKTFSLVDQFDYYIENGEPTAYKQQLNAMITYAGSFDDLSKQLAVSSAYATMPVDLVALRNAYGDLIVANNKSKPKNLLDVNVQVNDDSRALAKQLFDSLPVAIDALIAKHHNLNVSKDTVLIALAQMIAESVSRKADKTKAA